MKRFLYLIQLLPNLGFRNVYFMLKYRLSLRLGLIKNKFKTEGSISGEFYLNIKKVPKSQVRVNPRTQTKADAILNGVFTYYHFHKFALNPTPNWFYDPFSEKLLEQKVQSKHWVEINEFDLNTGDIKNIWELSRFDWLTDLARAYVECSDEKYLKRINILLNDWSDNNPVNLGVHWRCGQEVSIRLMKLFHVSMIFDSVKDITSVLAVFVFQHLKRIEGNIGYAIAQDNNHGTSEAAALYIGSCWLLNQTETFVNIDKELLHKYRRKGRDILVNRVLKLISKEGTFSQKSVNYHRVVLDTMSFVLYGMKVFDEKPFSNSIHFRLKQLGEWLYQMVSNRQGNVPVLGANDGAMLENLHNCDYRDYRPSLQLFYALLNKIHLWDSPELNEVLTWRGVNFSELMKLSDTSLKSKVRDNEFVQIVHEDLILRIKATQNNFRPGNDVLHLDLWYKSCNVLVDTGSYSYNSYLSKYFRSIQSHNSLQFGKEEPMPRISRFLNGKWVKVKTSNIKESETEFSWYGEYTDFRGNYHKRKVIVSKNVSSVEIVDSFISKYPDEIKTLRFYLGDSNLANIKISCSDHNGVEIPAKYNKNGIKSLYYMQKANVPLYEFETLVTEGEFRTIIDYN